MKELKYHGISLGVECLDPFKIELLEVKYTIEGPFMISGDDIMGYTLYLLKGNTWVPYWLEKSVMEQFEKGLLKFIKYTPAELDDEGEEKMDLLDKTLGMQVYVNKAEGRVVLKTEDGDTYKAKCSVDDEFDIEKGVMLAMLKECYGPRAYRLVEDLVNGAIDSKKEVNGTKTKNKLYIEAGKTYRATTKEGVAKIVTALNEQGFKLSCYELEQANIKTKLWLARDGEVYFITYFDKFFQPANHDGSGPVIDVK